jgi:transcriptional regulator with XRE-family HTH domain
MNRIAEWLDLSGQNQSQFANELGVTPATVSRWMNGTRSPRWEQLRKINAVTKGFITANHFVPAAKADAEPDRKNDETRREAGLQN